ncbi:sigma 54-interacting transcriptional regulator, partial [Sphaerochaeta sp. S2]|uniref:sigma 54-interacting transcriptional regulator n=1 Tax=Sphaerochaeta sp. S2 TaxID=2798868 RepID=UPI001E574B7A
MVSLKRISNYVDQTANIIANVLQFDVLIVDKTLQIIGDSDLASVSENECIRTDSILARVIEEKKRVVLNSKDDNKGCKFCTQRNSCLVEMIIGIPIFYQGDILGSVGVIANTLSDRDKMISNQENYLKFVDHMIELIVNKLKEEQDYEVISLLKKRREVVLDSIDQFLVLVSNNGEILQTNLNFKKVFNRKKPEHLSEFFDAECIKLLLNKSEVKYKEVKIDKKYDFIISSKPVVLNDQDRGALITFRSLKDIAVEMNELYTHSMDVAFDDLIGESVQIKEVKERIKQISNSDSTVLIEGETGTGKEVIARLIHNVSSRKDELFVAINCSAIPEDLMESELFGYEDGAFSGARKGGKIGKFHLADGGTIFLDEIGE